MFVNPCTKYVDTPIFYPSVTDEHEDSSATKTTSILLVSGIPPDVESGYKGFAPIPPCEDNGAFTHADTK